MITKPANIKRIKERVGQYLSESADDYIKVAHKACAEFDDDDIEEALAYIDDVLGDGARGEDEPKQEPKKVLPVRLPDDQDITIGDVEVRVLSRAYQHIPPAYWKGFAKWIASSSLGAKIKEYGSDGVRTWKDVTSTSDEALGGARIKIVCSWDRGALVIYHAQPDMHNYASFGKA